jgi:hypothetical protein
MNRAIKTLVLREIYPGLKEYYRRSCEQYGRDYENEINSLCLTLGVFFLIHNDVPVVHAAPAIFTTDIDLPENLSFELYGSFSRVIDFW